MSCRPLLFALALLVLGAPVFGPDGGAWRVVGDTASLDAPPRATLQTPAPRDPARDAGDDGMALASSEPTESEEADSAFDDLGGALPTVAPDAAPTRPRASLAAHDALAPAHATLALAGLPRGPPALG